MEDILEVKRGRNILYQSEIIGADYCTFAKCEGVLLGYEMPSDRLDPFQLHPPSAWSRLAPPLTSVPAIPLQDPYVRRNLASEAFTFLDGLLKPAILHDVAPKLQRDIVIVCQSEKGGLRGRAS